MCKLHGVRLIKGIKIFESMPKKIPLLLTKRLGVSCQHLIALVLLLCTVVKYFGEKCGLSYVVNLSIKTSAGQLTWFFLYTTFDICPFDIFCH